MCSFSWRTAAIESKLKDYKFSKHNFEENVDKILVFITTERYDHLYFTVWVASISGRRIFWWNLVQKNLHRNLARKGEKW